MAEFILKHVSPVSEEALKLTNKLFNELKLIYDKGILENFIEENSEMKIFVISSSESGESIAGGALKHVNQDTVEIKRMFVEKEFRGLGISKQILFKLETIAESDNYKRIILETGSSQPEALSLYRKNNYKEIKCFGRHSVDPESKCFEKFITKLK